MIEIAFKACALLCFIKRIYWIQIKLNKENSRCFICYLSSNPILEHGKYLSGFDRILAVQKFTCAPILGAVKENLAIQVL